MVITAKAQDVVGALDLGDGVSYMFTGENETIMEAVQQLLLMLVLGILPGGGAILASFASYTLEKKLLIVSHIVGPFRC